MATFHTTVFRTTVASIASLLVLSSNSYAQKSESSQIFLPKEIAGLTDIVIPTPSKVLEPISPQAFAAANERFQLGLQHMGRKEDSKAIAVFRALIEDFPSLREPYNNLAILYAKQKQFDKSRAALDLMLRVHPNYINGYETLGDVYAQMAKDSYSIASTLRGTESKGNEELSKIRPLGRKAIGEQ